jgi:hypothetical protein
MKSLYQLKANLDGAPKNVCYSKYICRSYSAVVAMFDFQPTQKVKTL